MNNTDFLKNITLSRHFFSPVDTPTDFITVNLRYENQTYSQILCSMQCEG